MSRKKMKIFSSLILLKKMDGEARIFTLRFYLDHTKRTKERMPGLFN